MPDYDIFFSIEVDKQDIIYQGIASRLLVYIYIQLGHAQRHILDTSLGCWCLALLSTSIYFVVEALGMKYVLILYHWVERCFEHDGRCSDSEGILVLQKVQNGGTI